MAKFTDQVTFNNVPEIVKTVSSAPFSVSNNYTFNDEETEITNIRKKLLNAVDIDWNTAKLGDAITALSANVQEGVAVSNITTTGELLKVIAQLQAQVNVLTTLVKGLYASLAS